MNKVKTIKRALNGLLILDKPVGITSNQALQQVKRLFNAKKAGHTGSLDPLASGVLPICFGEATKFSQFLLDADKTYLVRAQLGIRTETGDAEGVVVSQKEVPAISESQLESILKNFRGEILQIPSMYSALKHQGKPLYEYARKGITVDRPARQLTIYELSLLEKTQNELTLRVHCSKGTYIRTLIDDIGEALGCGAHVAMLRRITAGPFREQDMISVESLETLDENAQAICLQSVEKMVLHLPKIELSSSTVFYMQQGQAVMAPNLPAEGLVRIGLKDGKFIGIGEAQGDGKVAPKKLLRTSLI